MAQFDTYLLEEHFTDKLRARWRSPRSFTAIVPMPGVPFAELTARLANLSSRFLQILGEVSDLHSFRLCAIPPERHSASKAHLLINFVHDRPLAEHVSRLLHVAGDLLNEALAIPGQQQAPADLVARLVRYRVRENTLHIGAIGLTVAEILANRRLRMEVEEFADRQLASGNWRLGIPAEVIRLEARKHIQQLPQSANMPRGPVESILFGGRVLRFGDLLLAFLFPALGVLHTEIVPAIRRIPNRLKRAFYWMLYGAWWIYGAVPTALSYLGVRLLEVFERDEVAPDPDEARLAVLESGEDIDPKNEVTLWFPVRNTWIRHLLMRVILWGSERGTRHFWTDGRLSKIDTIHYARILQVDGGRTMIFLSDYDGGLNRYLADFIGEGSNAVIPISSSVAGCPKTRWLFLQDDPDTFAGHWRNLIRSHQLETAVWFNAYPLLTVTENLENLQFRNGLFAQELSESEAQRWVRRI